MPAAPIRLAPYAAIADSQMLHIVPPRRYASLPPGLTGFTPADDASARATLRLWARERVDCPAEAVMLYRNAVVLHGRHVLGADGTGVAESFAQAAPMNVPGDATPIETDGPPVALVFGPGPAHPDRAIAEILPRLVLLHAAGLRQLRLLVPDDAAPLWPLLALALEALGMAGTMLRCLPGAALRVAALHWATPAAAQEPCASPTLLSLRDRLRAAARPAQAGSPSRLYLAEAPVPNAPAVHALLRASGYDVVDPAHLPPNALLTLFAGARRVLAHTGGALAWQVAMAPGGALALLDDGRCDPVPWDLACLCGHRFTYGFTPPAAAVDLDLLAALLDELERPQ